MKAYEELKDTLVTAKKHPHTFGWFCLVSQFAGPARNAWTAAPAQGAKGGKKGGDQGGKQKGGKKGKQQKKEEEVEVDDLFGDDDDDDEAAKKAAADAKKKAQDKKKPKKPVIAMSLVMLEVKPLDDKTDLDKVAARCFKEI